MSVPGQTAGAGVASAYDRVREWVTRLGVAPDSTDPPPGGDDAPPAPLPPFARALPDPERAELRRYAHLVAPPPVPAHVAPSDERRAALLRLGGEEMATVLEAEDAGADAAWAHRALDEVEALVALDRGAAILDDFRAHGQRRVVLEIDGGTGSFAWRFGALCPEVTYVLAARPETFLFSATELMTAVPGAGVHLWEEGESLPPEAGFVCLPLDRLDELRPDRLDLTLNLGSFGGLAGPELDAHLERVHRLGSRYLYGLGPHRSAAGAPPDAARAFERFYWLQEAPVLPASYRTLLRENPNAKFKGGRASASIHRAFAREHLVGWRRLRP